MAFKKIVPEVKKVEKKVEKKPEPVKVPELDPSIPESKQRWLRQ
jgi:hypothetical protein